ncbi:hypothetical protein [Fibrella forsythiae]|uniref:Uncharacterized protein n=1 Tax=Fibrella forsythiae TaxID=2817061 RepID=A0ABS3JHS1_9BACT|nr:hypothetical protein [Fibrella forsythiae]MBO0949567.1 hypothetical protein [Fibrella forsythiae]
MKRRLLWVAAAIPVVYYVGMVIWYAYDFPYMDDYPVVVDFLNRLPAAETVSAKTALLLEQNNFHRLVLAKLIAWLNMALTGSVDFRVMQYVGLLALLGTSWLLYRSAESSASIDKPDHYRVTTEAGASALQLPVFFLLFQFQGWNVAFWSIVAASNVTAPALALLAIYLANRRREGWAIGVAFIALFTNGNGILVLPILLLGWLFQHRWRWAMGTLLITIPALLYYFRGYQNPSGLLITQLISVEHIRHLLALDTAFLGAIAYHPAVAWLPILLGSITIIWALYLLRIRYDRLNPTLFWLLVFLHLTGLMLAVNRIQNDTSIVFASRYRNITALHMAATYLSVLDVLIRRDLRWRGIHLTNWFAGVVLAGTIGLWAISNVTYLSKIERFRELKQTDNLLWQRYGQIRACAPQYEPASRLSDLASQGVFRPRPISPASLKSRPVTVSPATTPGDSLVYGIDIRRRDEGFLVVSGWAKVAGRKANFNDTFVGVKTATGWQYYTTLFHQRLDKEDSANDKDTGFTAIIPAAQPTDSLAIFVRSGNYAAMVDL